VERSEAREFWNQRYLEEPWPEEPSPWLVTLLDRLGDPGRVLDVAGGTGRNALFLAAHGWTPTIVDASDVGLGLARRRAEELGLPLTTLRRDLQREPLPEGPWDLALVFHYLDRDVLPTVSQVLRPGGRLVGAIATVRNLERHPRPPRPYLLDEGELPGLLPDVELLDYREGWFDDRHEARFFAERPSC